jgi:hypothetical protein
MSNLFRDEDGRVMLDYSDGGEHWSFTTDTEQRFLTVSKAGLIVVVPVPSAAVWAKLGELAGIASNLHRSKDPTLDYRERIGGASK